MYTTKLSPSRACNDTLSRTQNSIQVRRKLSVVALTLSAIGLTPLNSLFAPSALASSALAQSEMPTHTISAQDNSVAVQFSPSTTVHHNLDELVDRGAPGGRTAAGTRSCNNLELLAVVPTVDVLYPNNKWYAIPMGTTVTGYPTFWFYLTETSPSIQTITFSLLDDQDNLVADILVETPEESGLFSVSWPNHYDPLQVGLDYHWLLDLQLSLSASQCNLAESGAGAVELDSLFVEGFIQRIALDTDQTEELITVTPSLVVARTLAEFGVWYDTFDTVMALQESNIALDTAIADLLTSIGLKHISPIEQVD